MNYFLIAYLVLIGASLLVSANRHGKPQANHNFWTSLIAVWITVPLVLLAIYFR